LSRELSEPFKINGLVHFLQATVNLSEEEDKGFSTRGHKVLFLLSRNPKRNPNVIVFFAHVRFAVPVTCSFSCRLKHKRFSDKPKHKGFSPGPNTRRFRVRKWFSRGYCARRGSDSSANRTTQTGLRQAETKGIFFRPKHKVFSRSQVVFARLLRAAGF